MPDFRCDMLDESGHTLFPAEIVAQDLEAAIRHGTDILHMSNDSSSRYVYSFEVWTGTSRLFPASLPQFGPLGARDALDLGLSLAEH
jgi:hypothetical protein